MILNFFDCSRFFDLASVSLSSPLTRSNSTFCLASLRAAFAFRTAFALSSNLFFYKLEIWRVFAKIDCLSLFSSIESFAFLKAAAAIFKDSVFLTSAVASIYYLKSSASLLEFSTANFQTPSASAMSKLVFIC